MKVLISPVSYEEAASITDFAVDILDSKNTLEGSLGAQLPWKTRQIVELGKTFGIRTSATLGDLPYQSGTAALAAFGAATLGVDYVKAGLYGPMDGTQAAAMLNAIRQAVGMTSGTTLVVASGYADYRRFGGLPPGELVRAAQQAASDVVMLDTAFKDGTDLFGNLSMDELRRFVDMARDAGLQVALAGSIRLEHVDRLTDLNPDIIGVRSAVCANEDRNACLCPEKTRHFIEFIRSIANRPQTC